MKNNHELDYDDYLPEISKDEFCFIQEQAHVTLEQIGRAAGLKSGSSVNIWMRPYVNYGSKDIKPYQVRALINAIGDKGIFDQARRKWAKMSKSERIEYIKNRYYLSHYNGEGDMIS